MGKPHTGIESDSASSGSSSDREVDSSLISGTCMVVLERRVDDLDAQENPFSSFPQK
jgi:hypothetical protein